jgi:hypothetical protein
MSYARIIPLGEEGSMGKSQQKSPAALTETPLWKNLPFVRASRLSAHASRLFGALAHTTSLALKQIDSGFGKPSLYARNLGA